MLESVLIAVLPTLTGCVVTYLLTKRDKKKKFKSKYEENQFFKFTRTLRNHTNEATYIMMFFGAWLIFYTSLRYIFGLSYLPKLPVIYMPILLFIIFIYTFFILIDVLFNTDKKE